MILSMATPFVNQHSQFTTNVLKISRILINVDPIHLHSCHTFVVIQSLTKSIPVFEVQCPDTIKLSKMNFK